MPLPRPYFALYLALAALPAQAGRSVTIPPITLSTVHGGAMPLGTGTPPPTQTCVTADMIPGAYAGLNDGVRSAVHSLNLAISNISTIDQTVRVLIQAGSNAGSNNSGGAANGIPLVGGPSISFTTDYLSGEFVIPPGGQYDYALITHCHDTLCKIEEIGPAAGAVIKGTYFPSTVAAGCAGNPQVCLTLTTNFRLKVLVNEDRGAIQAHATALAHRCNGFVDHFSMPPYATYVNGGRAF